MKILLVGNGGREHALAWKFVQDGAEVVSAPGNPGIAALARCVPVKPTDLDALVALARDERVAFTMVGPEAPLAAGIVDRFRTEGLAIFGPTAGAARIETSKRWAKELMGRAGVPTARASTHTDIPGAIDAARALGAPVVIKASGLAAGKGVVVAGSLDEAERAIRMMLEEAAFGEAGAEVLVEEFMEGEELSLFAVCDGERAVPLLPAQDHKRLLEGDAGPNTGGMGAYAPVGLGTPGVLDVVQRRVLEPTLRAMKEEGVPFTGLLYAGLMLTREGPKVVEFNCRFGDPETQAVLPMMRSSLVELLHAVAVGDGLAAAEPPRWREGYAVGTVVAAPGYPESARTGGAIVLPATRDDVLVFHAGTAQDADGTLRTAGGRVLAVVACAETFEEARARSVEMAQRVEFEGRQFRSDIGWREARRHAGTA